MGTSLLKEKLYYSNTIFCLKNILEISTVLK